MVGGDGYVLTGSGRWWIYFGWWWVVVDIFWMVVGCGGWWCVVVGGGIVQSNPIKKTCVETDKCYYVLLVHPKRYP